MDNCFFLNFFLIEAYHILAVLALTLSVCTCMCMVSATDLEGTVALVWCVEHKDQVTIGRVLGNGSTLHLQVPP